MTRTAFLMFTDLTFALRQLAKSPGFTLIALLTLAVGIGSATVVFAAVNALLLKPLPFLAGAEDRLVHFTETDVTRKNDNLGVAYPDYVELRERATTLAGLWIHTDRTVILGGAEIPDRQVGTEITWDAFALMGVPPVRGRGFAATDAALDAPGVALISAGLWRSRFGGRDDAVGTSILLNGQPATIIGVMPAGWRYPDLTDVWTPLRADPEKAQMRGWFMYTGRARLRDGVPLARARAEVEGIMGALAQAHPHSNAGISAQLRPIRDEAVQYTRQQTVLLFGAVLFVFLIACLNVTNLLLARGVSRAKEIAIRLALGAERARLIRQLITENVALGLLGGLGGLILGLWANDALVAAIPIPLPFWLDFSFDFRVVGFAVGLSLLAALVFGIAPALRATQPALLLELKEGGRGAEGTGPRANRLRNLLVVVEVALALVLLVGAGLMMRSFLELRRLHPGFEPRQVLSFRTGFPPAMFGENKEIPAQFFATLLPRLAALPGVEAVGAISTLPGTDGGVSGYLREGQARPARASEMPIARFRLATQDYFATVRIPLRAGRTFDAATDRPDTPRVAVVDESFALANYGSLAAALGQRLAGRDDDKEHAPPGTTPAAAPRPITIVGVVGNIRHRLDRDEPEPTVYLFQTQDPSNFLSVVVRTRDNPIRLLRDNSVRDTVLAINPAIPIYYAQPLADVLMQSQTVWPRKFFGWLFTVFGGVALFLACIGIYGVMAYNVTQRTQELGVRIALGAQPREVIGLIVRHGLRLVGYGLGLGLVAALLLANLLTGLLYGVSPHDPPTFALVPLLLAAVAVLACWLPSRRATRIEPNAALRAD